MNQTSKIIAVLTFGLFILVVGMYIGNPFEEEPKPPEPDTVAVEKKVPEIVRDTVVKEVPKVVKEYQTITDTVIRRVPMPRDFNLRGLLPQNFVERSTDAFSVTYYDPALSQYRTETYALRRPTNALEIGMTGIGTSRLLFSGLHLKYQRPRWSITGGYGYGITRSGFYRSPFLMAQFTFTGFRF